VDRTKTAEEIEAAEAAELESAERNRLKRARGDDDDDDGGDDTHGKPGGFAARRAKAKQADAKLAKREARGADGGDDDSDASDDDLRDAKSGKRKSGDDLEDGRFDLDSSEEDGSGDDASGSDSGFDSDEYDNDQDLDQDETAALKKNVKGMRPDLEAGKARLRKLGILKDGGPEEVEVEEEEEEEEEEAEEGEEEEEAEESEEDEAAPAPSVPLQEKSTKEKKIEAPKKSNTTPVTVETLPFVFAMPETTTGLDEITKGLSPAETRTVLDRVRKLHAPSLKPENRKLTQNFLGLLLRKFETLAGEIPLPVPYMDAVVAVIIPVAGTVPFFAATAARTRVEKMANRLRYVLQFPNPASLFCRLSRVIT
jgi:nucleolar protein 14|tara:strand:- start:19009 stop:20112 length:1104 start_codon:yes stop_codon:yes gene_type:complete